ncbi:MAG: hypothetical protein CFE24_02825 [Flavobacterium sp. BFFFF2]|nr:MAG: hypothetical protein CFE24_02825 [Flavobacterium sp. BFFFF2]
MESNNTSELKKNGWLLIKNFFDPSYCDELRAACYESTAAGFGGTDLLSNKYLNSLFLHEKLMALLTELIGEKPIYFGDSTYQIASVEGGILTGFHKDSMDRNNPEGLDWRPDYSLIRIGIYLQDHKNYSEGLVVRSQSHRTTDLKFGDKINVPSEKGDLIVWYLTTTHTGNAKRIKGTDKALLMNDSKNNIFGSLYRKYLKLKVQPSQTDRVAMFATFAKNDKHLERYLKYLKHRAYMVAAWKKCNYDNEMLQKIKAQNALEVVDMKKEAEAIDLSNFDEYNFKDYKKYNI